MNTLLRLYMFMYNDAHLYYVKYLLVMQFSLVKAAMQLPYQCFIPLDALILRFLEYNVIECTISVCALNCNVVDFRACPPALRTAIILLFKDLLYISLDCVLYIKCAYEFV